jgi:DNA mismatch repair protein PMS2
LISSATWGQGRSSADRQFYYINGRPVDIPVVSKAVNEVYKSFNTHQLPVVVLDFSVPKGAGVYQCPLSHTDMTESVDINVSPDKRSIFLHSETQLVEALKVGSFPLPAAEYLSDHD